MLLLLTYKKLLFVLPATLYKLRPALALRATHVVGTHCFQIKYLRLFVLFFQKTIYGNGHII